MEMFALNEEVTALENRLAASHGAARLPFLIELAWHLRQRDCERALLIAQEAETLSASLPGTSPEHQRDLARMMLVRGEVEGLRANFEAAQSWLHEAIRLFAQLDDQLGMGDAKGLLSFFYIDQGKPQLREAMINMMLEHYRLAGDQQRLDYAMARRILIYSTYDSRNVESRLMAHFCKEDYPLATQTWIASARGYLASTSENPGDSTKFTLLAHQTALDTGQIRQAIAMACNSADAFASLGDLDAALKLDESALALACHTGWPCSIGFALLQTGNVLRLLGRLTDAKDMLYKALQVMKNLRHSHSCMMAMLYLGEVALDMNDAQSALAHFEQAGDLSSALRDVYYLLRCWRGQAHALCRLGRPEKALMKAQQALVVAEQQVSVDDQIQILRVFAELHHFYPLPAPEGMTAPNAELHYLTLALKLGTRISNYSAPIELLEKTASSYAAAGEFEQACHYAMQAIAGRSRRAVVDAQDRAISMQIHRKIESILSEAEDRVRQAQQKLAEEQARSEAADRAAMQANLRMLQAQIEPHFLFNSLANVVGLIHSAPDTAKKMLENFITYLRASLAATRAQETTLGDEFGRMGTFLEILKIRMGERLRVTLDLPEDLVRHSFPPMLLQPLLENAIKHGLEPKIEGGSVLLQARRTGSKLAVSVIDTGLGFQPGNASGIGLCNARERINQLFNHTASLQIEENTPCGTRVIITIPVENES